jgi:hypothetical protein
VIVRSDPMMNVHLILSLINEEEFCLLNCSPLGENQLFSRPTKRKRVLWGMLMSHLLVI